MRLTRLKIIRHRWCAPTELILGAKRQLVLGKNGTGKTKLLELIALVCSGTMAQLAAEPLEVEAEWEVDEDVNYGEAARLVGRLTLEIRVTERPAIEFPPEFAAQSGVLNRREPTEVRLMGRWIAGEASSVADFSTQFLNGQTTLPDGTVELVRVPNEAHHWDATIGAEFNRALEEGNDRRFYCLGHLVSLANATRFDEVLGGYSRFRESELDVLGKSDAKPSFLWNWIGGALVLYRHPRPLAPGDELVIAASDIKAFRSVKSCLQYEPINVRFRFAGSKGHGELARVYYNDPQIQFKDDLGNLFRDEDLSHGEKRALAFLFYCGEHRLILIADELMNGLHHSLGVALLNEIGDRQAFLATHEPVLMDHVDFESADELRRSLIHCERNPDPKGPPFVWSQIDEAKAERMFRDYRVDSLLKGHELLKDWGIW